MIDRRFPTALQIMQSLTIAQRDELGYVGSAEFAKGLGTHPALVRRLLATLSRNGLLDTRLGRSGGVRLSRPADQISLADIYTAAVENKDLWAVRPDLPHRCVVSSNFEAYFSALTGDADKALRDMLRHRSLADSVDQLLALDDLPHAAE